MCTFYVGSHNTNEKHGVSFSEGFAKSFAKGYAKYG